MSEKSLKTILMGLGVLVALWLVTQLVPAPDTDPGVGDGRGLGVVLDELDVDSVTAVRFSGGSDAVGAVQLERTDAGWSVDGYPADSLQVVQLFQALDRATAGVPVATNPANHARMEVDDVSARTLVLEEGDRADTLLLGKAGPSQGSVYARLPGRDEVWLVDADLSSHAAREPSAWRSRRISSVDTTTVSAIELTVADESLRIERTDSSWAVAGGGTADDQAVRDVLSELRQLDAARFPPTDSVEVISGGPPDRVVTALGDDAAVLLVVQLWDPADGGAGANVAGRADGPMARQAGVTFDVPVWRADRLAPSFEHLLGAP